MLKRIIARLKHPFSRWDRLYESNDPWGFERESEKHRFAETNRIIREHIGPVGSLLEIASAEGHQTRWLLEVAKDVHGVEPSKVAVDHARKEVPEATFSVGELPYLAAEKGPYDLACALEVIGFVDPSKWSDCLRTMERLGTKRMVSLYYKTPPELNELLSAIPGVNTETIYWEGHARWRVWWW